jgi:hypothetical protein
LAKTKGNGEAHEKETTKSLLTLLPALDVAVGCSALPVVTSSYGILIKTTANFYDLVTSPLPIDATMTTMTHGWRRPKTAEDDRRDAHDGEMRRRTLMCTVLAGFYSLWSVTLAMLRRGIQRSCVADRRHCHVYCRGCVRRDAAYFGFNAMESNK